VRPALLQFPAGLLLPPTLLAHAHGYGASAEGGVTGLLQLGTAVTTPYGTGIVENIRIGFLDLRAGEEEEGRMGWRDALLMLPHCSAHNASAPLVLAPFPSGADDAAPLPPVARRAAAAAAAAAPLPFVAYHVFLPWGRAILEASQVRPRGETETFCAQI
jgi:hypothetical protein